MALYGEIAAAMQTVLLRARRLATKPMRRMFVSRSSLLNPRPLLRFVRTTSPSSSSTVMPRLSIVFWIFFARVVLPAPESPVNQIVKPVVAMGGDRSWEGVSVGDASVDGAQAAGLRAAGG